MKWKIPAGLRYAIYNFFTTVVWRDQRPRAMYRRNRVAVNDFRASERLYFRWFSNWLDASDSDYEIRPENVPIPNQSVNRSRHGGRCWFVLIREPPLDSCDEEGERNKARRQLLMGVVRLRRCELPPPTTICGKSYSFAVEHNPSNHNYQHCEIGVYEDGWRLNGPSSSMKKAVKKYYRVKVAERAVLILHPEIATQDS